MESFVPYMQCTTAFDIYSVPSGLGTGVIRFVVAILAPRVQVPDLKGLGPSDRKTGGGGLVSTLHYSPF